MSERRNRLARRSFLARAGAGAAAVGAAIGASAPAHAAQSAADSAPFRPARHAEDDWYDSIPGKHRFFIDTMTFDGLGLGLRFASNYYTANKDGYGLEPADLAVVICMRHQSTAFAFNDAMWAKYGKPLAERINFTDPKTKAVPTVNVYQAAGYGSLLESGNTTIDAIIKRGAHFAVCGLSMRANAAIVARQTGGKADEIYQELAAHLVPNAHIAPAGIVAVNRAQERGYSFAYTG
jgi:intracellular sulfur oxidation DsrE/DsrF family protein